MYNTSDIRKNLKVKIDGAPWTVVEFQFVKPGKGTAFTRTKFKNLITGQVVERNIRSGERLEPVDLDIRKTTLMYTEGDDFHFMETDTYEQFTVSRDALGGLADWMTDNMAVELLFFDGRPVTVEIANFVELEITYCEPAVKGDTATNTTKPATVSTGTQVQVPLFIAEGETIRIDTRTREYVGRVK
jgi:elongation factor P